MPGEYYQCPIIEERVRLRCARSPRMPPDTWNPHLRVGQFQGRRNRRFRRRTTDDRSHTRAQPAHRGRSIPPPDRRRRNAPQSPSPQTHRQRRDAA